MKQLYILVGAALAVILVSGATSAYAQYFGGQTTGKNTLEESLKLAQERVAIAKANPATGSGTPYLAADGVLGASAIAGAIFGGIAAAFFLRGRHGRYAAVGRG